VPASGARLPQTEICARALANPRHQGLSACRPQGDARGNLSASYFRTAPPVISSRQVFPGLAKFSVALEEHRRTCGSGILPRRSWLEATPTTQGLRLKAEDWLLLSYLKSLLTTKYAKGAKTLSHCLRTKAKGK
jgi:hypothetical protein